MKWIDKVKNFLDMVNILRAAFMILYICELVADKFINMIANGRNPNLQANELPKLVASEIFVPNTSLFQRILGLQNEVAAAQATPQDHYKNQRTQCVPEFG